MNASDEESDNYFSAGEEDEVLPSDDGINVTEVLSSNPHPLSRPVTNRIYEVLWRTEMFQERGPRLKVHMLEGKFDLLPEKRDDEAAEATLNEMDKDLWCQLSNDLIKRVLFRLPFAIQCRFRSVNKAFRSNLPETPPILCAYENSCPLTANQFESESVGYVSRILGVLGFMSRKSERPALLGVVDRSEECFRSDRAAEEFARRLRDDYCGSQLRKVHQIDLSFAPSWIVASRFRACRDGLLYTFPLKTPPKEEGRASSSTSNSGGSGGLCLLNPFTRTWRTLPNLPKMNDSNSACTWQDWCEVMVDDACPSHFVVYVLVSTEDKSHPAKGEWSICRYSSSKSDSWFITPGDSEFPFRHESLCFARQHLYSWFDGRLSTYNLETGKLLTIISPGNPPALPSGFELLEVERIEIVEYKGTIYGAMSFEVRLRNEPTTSTTVIGISKLGADMRWERAVIMPEWAMSMNKRRMLELVSDKEMADEHWLFLDYAVLVLADYVCFKLLSGYIHGGNGRRVVSQSVVALHIPSQAWKSFDLYIPHLLGATDLEVFQPNCLHVYL